jgi:hypothetical protein
MILIDGGVSGCGRLEIHGCHPMQRIGSGGAQAKNKVWQWIKTYITLKEKFGAKVLLRSALNKEFSGECIQM